MVNITLESGARLAFTVSKFFQIWMKSPQSVSTITCKTYYIKKILYGKLQSQTLTSSEMLLAWFLNFFLLDAHFPIVFITQLVDFVFGFFQGSCLIQCMGSLFLSSTLNVSLQVLFEVFRWTQKHKNLLNTCTVFLLYHDNSSITAHLFSHNCTR